VRRKEPYNDRGITDRRLRPQNRSPAVIGSAPEKPCVDGASFRK
jgi:hypothetical protein